MLANSTIWSLTRATVLPFTDITVFFARIKAAAAVSMVYSAISLVFSPIR